MTTNQLILSTNGQFCQQHISAAIADSLNRGEKVLVITDSASLSATLHTYAPIIPKGRARTMTDLAIQITPENKPFLAFQEWDVIVTTPDYLRVPLTSSQVLLDKSELKNIGLIVVDTIDDLIQQPVVKLVLDEFCLSPVDGILRQIIVAMNPIQNALDVARWLRADSVTDSNLAAVQHQLDINGLTAYQHRKGQDNFLLRYDLAAEDTPHLQRGLKIKHLSWLDLLIVAASTPDFPVKPTVANGKNLDKHLALL